ncbi:hypothetical protein [Paraburkholderia solisilvae]|uniref:Uncharacterized protein n=1 Tax=Paraburkholderia solisilvae TaxID=624376 RepID=A0A6J5DCS4_9BURK|nr:hypothetical protein [Paraburkholderia solisilvae]CAB3751187.1 hypothetical protein LMG29739_01247 [Paraburkholderia solisilvae]
MDVVAGMARGARAFRRASVSGEPLARRGRLAGFARVLAGAVCAAGMTGCTLPLFASHAQNRAASFRQTEIELAQAREQASFVCADEDACDRTWERVQTYVEQHSATRIVRISDTAIETGMPHQFGVAYFWAERTRDSDGATHIRLKGMCRGMYTSDGGPGWTYATCATQIAAAESGFRDAVRG